MGLDRTARRAGWRWWLIALAALAALAGCRDRASAVDLGRALFLGERPPAARMVGHTIDLAASVVHCANCHRHEPRGDRSGDRQGGSTSQDFGPALTHDRLTRPLRRRGGPPSVYDRPRLCRVLREGIDPSSVMISQAMPRYNVTDAECEALWAYLTND
jgi:hypothetical protein